jgi:hypothetical protein
MMRVELKRSMGLIHQEDYATNPLDPASTWEPHDLWIIPQLEINSTSIRPLKGGPPYGVQSVAMWRPIGYDNSPWHTPSQELIDEMELARQIPAPPDYDRDLYGPWPSDPDYED